jgi:hypothetical protein
VVIDDGDTVETPAHVELAPGAHSFELKASVAESTWYEAQPKQWVSISAGQDMTIPIKLAVARARLEIKLVPRG